MAKIDSLENHPPLGFPAGAFVFHPELIENRRKNSSPSGRIPPKSGVYQLLEAKEAHSLESEFTGCVITLPPDFCTSNGEEISDFLHEHVEPYFYKLLPGAHILFRAQNPELLIEHILYFGTQDMPLRAALRSEDDSSDIWLLFQKLGQDNLPKINIKKSFPDNLPHSWRTELENQIFSDSIYRYSETQNVLRPLVEMICPNPKKSKILVPFYGAGEVIAACEALKISSVGFDYLEEFHLDDNYARDVIKALSEMPIE